jgi:hypothetical protein
MAHVGFEVLTAAVINNCIFWDIKPRSPMKVNGCFQVTCPLHLQVRISQVSNQYEANNK